MDHEAARVTEEVDDRLAGLTQYILSNPFSVEKMTPESPTAMVIYRSRRNARINRICEVFTATDFLAAITQHSPDKGAQMVRYYVLSSQTQPVMAFFETWEALMPSTFANCERP